MKVNTDGVLLGAWAETAKAKYMLDIGTGTGVIALMLAQRNSEAIIDAVDIDGNAFAQAKKNFQQSKWSNRLRAIHSALQSFEAVIKYDAIISNPPYFIDDYKSGNQQKDVARHSIELTYGELLSGISRLLAADGKAFLVIPHFNLAVLELFAGKKNLFITKAIDVIAVEGKLPYLVLVQLEKGNKEVEKNELTIQHPNGKFTEAYKLLTREFYLKF